MLGLRESCAILSSFCTVPVQSSQSRRCLGCLHDVLHAVPLLPVVAQAVNAVREWVPVVSVFRIVQKLAIHRAIRMITRTPSDLAVALVWVLATRASDPVVDIHARIIAQVRAGHVRARMERDHAIASVHQNRRDLWPRPVRVVKRL